MYVALVILYVIICFFLILVVLLQQGKGADIASAFGGGASQTAFGARGATTFLQKMTTGAFAAFVVISVLLSILDARPKSSVVRTLPAGAATQKAPGPVAPAPAAAQPAGAAPAGASEAPAVPAPAPAGGSQPSTQSPPKP